MQDELEILRVLAAKVPEYEAKLDTYQKRLQDMGDLRRQIALLEDKNTDYMQQNMELEEVRLWGVICVGGGGGGYKSHHRLWCKTVVMICAGRGCRR